MPAGSPPRSISTRPWPAVARVGAGGRVPRDAAFRRAGGAVAAAGAADRGGPDHAPAPGRNGHAVSTDPRPALIRAHLRTMDEFLETQRQVMDAYVAARSHRPAPRGAFVSSRSISPTLPAHRLPPPRAGGPEWGRRRGDAPLEVTPPTAGRGPRPREPERRSAEQILLEQVSRRTGYPRAMLKLDFDMEADLGIDSIKRVEIFGELQAEGVVPEQIDMDRLSKCRTLGEVLALLEPAPRSHGASPPTPGPWVGTIESLDPGRELVALRRLDAEGRPRRRAPHARRPAGLGARPDAARPAGRAVHRHDRDAGPGGAVLAPGRVVVGAPRRPGAPLDPLRGGAGRPRDPRPDRPRAARRGARRDLQPRAARARRNGSRNGTRRATAPWSRGGWSSASAAQAGPVAPAWDLEQARACRFDAAMIYRDQWLFHGPRTPGGGRDRPDRARRASRGRSASCPAAHCSGPASRPSC